MYAVLIFLLLSLSSCTNFELSFFGPVNHDPNSSDIGDDENDEGSDDDTLEIVPKVYSSTTGFTPEGAADEDPYNFLQQVSVIDEMIWVADACNNRVLMWDQYFADNAPNLILGGFPGSDLDEPGGVAQCISGAGTAEEKKQVFIADTRNKRIVGWSMFPGSSTVPPDITLRIRNAAKDQDGEPETVFCTDTHLLVSDQHLQKIDFYRLPVTDGDDPEFNFQLSEGSNPQSVFVHGGKLYVTEIGHHRVSIWDQVPTSSSGPIDPNWVLGQADATTFEGDNRGGNVDANTLDNPEAIFVDNDHIFVADSNNNRILVWEVEKLFSGDDPDRKAHYVLGQPNFTSRTPNNPALGDTHPGLDYPHGLTRQKTDTSDKLWVSNNKEAAGGEDNDCQGTREELLLIELAD